MKNVSIEYAHIYTNQRVSEEHKLSLEILNKLQQDLKGQTTSLTVMVDDYSFPDPTFDYVEFTDWLAENGQKPNLVIRESQLIPVCDMVLENLSDQALKEQLTDYIKAKKYPCSLFIAAWYLLRLGHLESPIFDTSLHAERLVNILPESFKPFEDKALEIIENTRFAEAAKHIDYKLFRGRLVL